MPSRHSSYSRMVAWLKILLPLIALGVLGTVFLINNNDGFPPGFTFSRADIASLGSGSFISKPRIEGVTTKGEPFSLNAERIAPINGDMNLVEATALNGVFRFETGGWMKITAESAQMDIKAQTVRFETGGMLETSDGNVAQVDTLLLHLKNGEIEGTGIKADGPLGQVSADRFRIDSNEGENRVLWFENNVKMRYNLQNESD